jgi:hypothetical protein
MTEIYKLWGWHNRSRQEILIVAAVFVIPALMLFPLVHLRTSFEASLKTGSIQFQTSGRPGKSTGLFNSDTAPVNLTIERFDRIEAGEGPSLLEILSPGGQGSVTFHSARFHSLDVQQPLIISLEAVDGKVILAVDTLRPDDRPVATAITSTEAQLSCDECVVVGADGKQISEPDTAGVTSDGAPRLWSVYKRKDSPLHLQLRARNGIATEREIDLARDSPVTFDREGRSAILGSDGALQVSSLEAKPITLKEGQSFVIRALQGDPNEGDAQIVSLAPEAGDFKVDVRGTSDCILLDKSNEAATPAEYLTSQRPLAVYLSTVALIGSTVLTILTRLKLIKQKE